MEKSRKKTTKSVVEPSTKKVWVWTATSSIALTLELRRRHECLSCVGLTRRATMRPCVKSTLFKQSSPIVAETAGRPGAPCCKSLLRITEQAKPETCLTPPDERTLSWYQHASCRRFPTYTGTQDSCDVRGVFTQMPNQPRTWELKSWEIQMTKSNFSLLLLRSSSHTLGVYLPIGQSARFTLGAKGERKKL